MTSSYVTEVLSNIDSISDGLDQNGLITKTRSAVQTGIKKFQITPAEQAKLYANFEMQFSLGVITKLIDVVIQSGLIEQQIAVEKKKIDLMIEQIKTQAEETYLKNAQARLTEQQILSEVQNTTKVTREHELLAENKALVMAQKATEEKRKLDVMAGINIKNEQALSTRQSAKFEEARRHVLIGSTQQNGQIQKSKEENATLNALALDADFTITESHLTRVKSALDGITLTQISYTEELTSTVGIVNAGV